MRLKILAIGITIMMLSITLLSTAELNNIGTTENDEIKEIRVAIYSMGDTYGSDLQVYFDILDGYQWKVGNKIYKFIAAKIDDKGIFKGDLNTENYDVFTIPYMEAQEMVTKLSHTNIRNIIWKNKIADFIKDGGGYFGHCAGTYIIGSGLSNQPETFFEKEHDKGAMHISQVKEYDQGGWIILDQLGHPEKIGSSAYVWFSGWDENNESAWFAGCCLDVAIDKNNPIFDDIYGDTRRFMWCGGPALIPPEKSNNVKVIACYPKEDISDNKSTQVHAWKYTGRLLGFLKGFLSTMKMGGTIFNKIYFTPFKATDWEMTDKIIQTDRANKPFMTMETYPNENQGRIIICGGHPEDRVWWGGHIEEEKDTSENNLYDSLYHWTDMTKVDYTYNWCIVRREAAWAAKVPDNDLPPIYGASQVSDINPYNQSSNFTIIGNAKEESEGIMSLDLYYRHYIDASSLSNWILYGTDTDDSDGWSWEFNASNASGSGYYQFYSIRNVQYEDHTERETAPPGPDAIAYVKIN